jgi:hypothetical protein
MTGHSALAFQTNANKDYLRRHYDLPIVGAWHKSVGHPLHYLGLPGPEMLDVVEWLPHIGGFSTIERSENEQHFMFLKANVKDLEHRLHSLYGEFDQILLSGRDSYGHSPRWPYDLMNLDFFGGLLYNNLSRPKALKKLINNQDAHGRSFLLIITCHVRDGDLGGEKAAFIDDVEAKLTRDFGMRPEIAHWSQWYRDKSTPDTARQSLYLNTLLHDEGEAATFRVDCRPPILYSGTGGAQMLHWVATFEHQKGAHRAVSRQSLVNVINLGYQELANERLSERVKVPRLTI